MDAGLAGVIGAAVGVVGGLGGGLLTFFSQSTQQQRQQNNDREHRLEQVRREAYLACIDTSKQITAAWWKLANSLIHEDATPEQRQEFAQHAQDGWVTFTKTADAVGIAGPNEMADAAHSLREAMWRMDRAGTSWFECVRSGDDARIASCEEEFRAAEAARTQQGFSFLSAARRALATEH